MEPDSKLTSLHDQRDVTDVISRADSKVCLMRKVRLLFTSESVVAKYFWEFVMLLSDVLLFTSLPSNPIIACLILWFMKLPVRRDRGCRSLSFSLQCRETVS